MAEITNNRYLFDHSRRGFQVVARTSTKHTTLEQFTKIGGGLQEIQTCWMPPRPRCGPHYATPASKAPTPAPCRCRTARGGRRAPSPSQTTTSCELSPVDPLPKRRRRRLLLDSVQYSSVIVLWSEHNSGPAAPESITSRDGNEVPILIIALGLV